MTPARSATQYLEEIKPLLGTVPAAALDFVCSSCFGPAAPKPGDAAPLRWWAQCYPCKKLFDAAPPQLRERFIAATTALDPSPWYSRLATYKRSAPELHPVVASVAWKFLHAHEERFSAMLGGPRDCLVLVPSTRGIPLDIQPLRKALTLATPLRESIVAAVRHNGLQSYVPEAFDVDAKMVEGKRIVVVDDTWVTGARLISVAGALFDSGAASVVPFAIAREVNASWCGADHPYRHEMGKPYDLSHWPRGE